jgi:hypothetical protein
VMVHDGMNDVPDPSPIDRLVRFAQRGESFPAEAEVLEPLDLDVSENPIKNLRTLSVLAGGEVSHFEFLFSECSHRHRLRAYLTELKPITPTTGIRSGCGQLIGASVVSIQGRSVFTVKQADLALTAAFDASAAGDPIKPP